MTAVFVLDGKRIRTLDDFWRVIMDAFDSPGRQYFGRNLDAFADCLSGGPGHPDVDDYMVEWRDHEVSRDHDHLGYPETVRQLELQQARCHPSNRTAVAARLAAACDQHGPTVFDQLVEIFENRAPGVLRLQ
ncbi:barstar family protein [Streptomyces sp. NBC_01012]|uniref:barstar family protein n=1 Tax=Streptomyces sp. NBC_01012 TaxID=2903717 RepID=UPI00386B9452|nr:barstar family protein [Streptomyces sp. NBC_01012]